MNDLIDTTEMYLRTIYELEEEGVVPLRARIVERLGQSGPTVSQTVSRMERDGLLIVSGDRHLELTETGRTRAIAVMRKHRLAERLLVDIIGLDWEDVHAEACRWEHVMSEAVERRLIELLGHPTTSPYGNPIPGLGELGLEQPQPPVEPDLVRLDEVARRGGGPVEVRRIAEHVQIDHDLMARLKASGVMPGSRIEVQPGRISTPVVVWGSIGRTQLDPAVAHAVLVRHLDTGLQTVGAGEVVEAGRANAVT